MTDTATLLYQIQATLADDAAIQAFCAAGYGSGPTVFLGVNEENPPAQDDYPVIAILDVRETRGRNVRERTWSVDLACGIIQPTVTTGTGTTTHAGMVEAEQLRSLIEAALLGMPSPAKISTSGDAGRGDAHPLYVSFTQIDFSEHVNSRT